MGSLFNTPSENVQAPTLAPTYQATGMSQADTGALGGISNLSNYNAYANLYPQVAGIGQGMINNPYSGAYLGASTTAGGMGMAGAFNQYGQGQNLYTMGNTVANTAFDPQSALYARTAQQVQDQQRAALEARGVNNTPYGAGVEGQTMANFNMDWQNQQLQRQLQGLQGAGSAFTTGSQMQGAAPGQFLTAGGMPYSTFQGIGATNLGTLGAMGQFGAAGANIPQMQIGDYMQYLGYGNTAAGTANQASLGLYADQLQQAKQSAAENAQMWSGIGQVAGGVLGTAVGGPFGATIGQQLAGNIFGGGGGGMKGIG